MNSNEAHLFWLSNDQNLSLAAVDAIRWTNSLEDAANSLYAWLSKYKDGKHPGNESWTLDGILFALSVIGEY